MKNKWLYWCGLLTLIFLSLPITAWAADSPVGVAYRGHIQDLGDYPRDGNWVNSPRSSAPLVSPSGLRALKSN